MSPSKKNYYTIGVISKCCLVLEMLASKRSWELAELCRALSMPKTTVHRILLTLEDQGYVVQERQRGEYSLSFKLFSIGSQVVRHTSILDVARPFCRELLDAVDETVNLCVVSDLEMLVIDKQVTSQSLRQDSIVGSAFPVFQSASGKVWLAFSDADESAEILRSIAERQNLVFSDTALNKLRVELDEVRQTGLAFDYEEVFQGVRCVAAPIFDFQGNITATLSISTPTIRLTEERADLIERELSQTVKKISKRLGATAVHFPGEAAQLDRMSG